MTIDTDDLMNSITESLGRINYIKADEIPNIELYMDQVTTFMDKRLRDTTRNKEEDKILTKTMINNYAKNDLFPSPVKKKYTKDHVIDLIFIFYLKNFLSISDIELLLKPLNEKYFGSEDGISLEDIYEEIRKRQEAQNTEVIQDIKDKYDASIGVFNTGDKEEEEMLQLFYFVILLSAEVYVKKLLIEKIIDGIEEKKKKAEEEANKKD